MSRSSFFGMALTHVLMTTSRKPADEPLWLIRQALTSSHKLRGK